ncbi:tyrosine-protein phosphatase [Cumulibacter manganitolerans]|uniref:tyrosine-protein phosphatase n=1 Tax=Cumulibacter manganitolerans TaxID=1884992 RepID=UPI00129573DD|nr:tyrosine-protein phosphatase [Cumulibacter manganitolerans]
MTGGASKAHERRVELDGMLNVRDLGGMPAAEGKQVRSGQILRMDSPQFMTESAAGTLLGGGFRTVLDLRYPTESEQEGIGFLAHERIRHVNVPIASSDNQTAPGLRQMLEAAEGQPPAEVVYEYYQGYFTTANGKAITTAVREMANADSLPLIVHCAAGKDRTGCVVATALSAIGVPDEVIADDYAASADAVPAIVARLHGLGTYGDIDQTTVDLQRTRAETMLLVLQWLKDEHGGARRFLLERGMTEDELERLEALLLVDADEDVA